MGPLATVVRALSQESAMADDMSKRGPAHTLRVNVNEDHELRCWTEALDVSQGELRAAVAEAGVIAGDVRAHLRKPVRQA